jgi:carbon storage regulator CsrA
MEVMMLVLSRKASEEIRLTDTQTGQTIVLMVVQIRAGKVRLGIQAPQTVVVTRGELLKNRQSVDQVVEQNAS